MNPPKRVKLQKPAPVRQTKTSIYRMAKLNPLLQQESDDPKIKKTILPPAVTGGRYKASEVREASNSHSIHTSAKEKAKLSMMCSKENLKVPECDADIPKRKPRRSLSAEHFHRKHSKLSRNEQMVKNTEMTQSLEDITLPPSEKKEKKKSSFYSFSKSVVLNSTPCSKNILRHLNRWLQRNGKSKSAYYHLKYFAVEIVEEEEENEICISPDIRSEIESASPLYAHRLENVLKDALDDLNHLTQSGYPLEQCEKWLAAIRKKYRNIEGQWQYWVCRASIEENRGNVSSAVECYQTAVEKGAEAEYIEDCLDQLFKKFTDMNTSNDGGHMGKVKDVCNIFKTCIVQFALHKRTSKTNEIKERITRRSSKF